MAFEVFNLGNVLQTAEAIKAARRQESEDVLRRKYLEAQIGNANQSGQIAAAQESRAAAQFSQEQQVNNTKLLNAAAAEIYQNPSAIDRWMPQLQQAGIMSPEFDYRSLSPDIIQQGARSLYESTGAALAALAGPQKIEPTTNQRDYVFYAQQETAAGRQPLSFNEWDLQSRKAGATTVNVNGGKMENAAQQAFGKAEGEAFGSFVQRGMDAADKAASLRALRENPAVTGPTQDVRAAGTALFADLGIPVSADRLAQVSNLGQYKALTNQLVLTEQLKQKGPQTESDAKRIAETFGKTTNLQEANRLIINYQLALADRETLLAQMADDYRTQSGKIDGWRNVVRDYVRSTPLAGINPQSGRLVFWNEFMETMKSANPELSDDEVLGLWRSKYGAAASR